MSSSEAEQHREAEDPPLVATGSVSCAFVALADASSSAVVCSPELTASTTVLATPPDVLADLAARAVQTVDEAERLRAQLGKCPPLNAAAEQAALAEWQALQDDRRAAVAAREDRLRLVTMANGAGLGWLAAALGLSLVNRQPLGPSVDLAVTLAATSPVAGFVTASVRARRARNAVADRRVACAEALARAGAKTLGDLRARRLLVESWSRRRDAARMAAKRANDALEAWHAVVGPDVAPEEVDVLLAHVEERRRELLDRMQAALSAHAEREASKAAVVLPFAEPLKALPPGGRVSAGLERLHGLKLRLWRTA
jgi:hypothetical protein